jgi:hypothetical protein
MAKLNSSDDGFGRSKAATFPYIWEIEGGIVVAKSIWKEVEIQKKKKKSTTLNL